MAVGSDGNVLRWARTGKMEQQFKFESASPGCWKIRNLKHGKYLHVHANGNITVENRDDSWKGQNFLILPIGGNKVMIQEMTKSELVSVGDNGNILRWGSTGKTNEQSFELIPQPIQNAPQLVRDLLL